MIIYTVILIALVVIIWLIPALRGAPARATELEPMLEDFLNRREQDDFHIAIRPKFSNKFFLQFSKYSSAGGTQGLELGFPDAEWSKELLPRVENLASRRSIPHEASIDRYPGMRFVFFRFGDSTSSAADFSRIVLNEIFEFELDYKFRVRIN